MAERRMFAKRIVDSDQFLDMPLTARGLYFHLATQADDDGFIDNPKKIVRAVGASADDMQCLLDNRYIIAFESGVIVVRHWKMHNYIQKDRYRPTIYSDEKAQLIGDPGKPYDLVSNMDTECIQNGYNTDTDCIQNGYVGKDRLGKDRLDKDSGSSTRCVSNMDTECIQNGYTAPTIEAYASSNLNYMSPRNMEELAGYMDSLPEELIRYAIDDACANGKRTWAYVRSILQRYQSAGYRTVGDVQAAGAQRARPALNYEQRQHTEGDFKGLFIDLEREYGEGRANEQ